MEVPTEEREPGMALMPPGRAWGMGWTIRGPVEAAEGGGLSRR